MSLSEDPHRWYRGVPVIDENTFGHYMISWGSDRRVSKAIYAHNAHLYENTDYDPPQFRSDNDTNDPQFTGWFLCHDLHDDEDDHKERYISLPDGLVHGYRYLPESPF
jgi:hypothetical protein